MEVDGSTWAAEREVLKAVFPLLAGRDLGTCLCVCNLWREVARDDYLWKQLCARRWPSVLNSGSSMNGSTSTGFSAANQKEEPMTGTVVGSSPGPYFGLFSSFGRKSRIRRMPSPKLRFEDLEFYIDIWSGTQPVFSTVVHGPKLLSRISNPPAQVSETLKDRLQSETYKLTVPVAQLFGVKLADCVKVSILVRRLDDLRVASITDMSGVDYHDSHENLAHAFQFLQISPLYPFVFPIRAWVALLLLDSVQGEQQVFGVELDFVDAANSDLEVLCLLEILDWKSIT